MGKLHILKFNLGAVHIRISRDAPMGRPSPRLPQLQMDERARCPGPVRRLTKLVQ